MSEALPWLVVGDVHGDLERLFKALSPYPPDQWRTVFLGDLVDGGPFGVGALRYARDRPHSTVLLGNHEVLMLAALADRANRGSPFLLWMSNGGQLHDLEELAKDETLQEWLADRPALYRLDAGTLAQHCDNDGYGRLGGSLEEINQAVRRLLASGDFQPLWDLMTPQGIFRTQPARLESWLAKMGVRRLVHGHTPHQAPGPDVYAGGRAIDFDGSFGRFGGARYRRRRPVGASVAPLPPAR